MAKDYSRDEDLEDAFWNDNFTGDRKEILHALYKRDEKRRIKDGKKRNHRSSGR